MVFASTLVCPARAAHTQRKDAVAVWRVAAAPAVFACWVRSRMDAPPPATKHDNLRTTQNRFRVRRSLYGRGGFAFRLYALAPIVPKTFHVYCICNLLLPFTHDVILLLCSVVTPLTGKVLSGTVHGPRGTRGHAAASGVTVRREKKQIQCSTPGFFGTAVARLCTT